MRFNGSSTLSCGLSPRLMTTSPDPDGRDGNSTTRPGTLGYSSILVLTSRELSLNSLRLKASNFLGTSVMETNLIVHFLPSGLNLSSPLSWPYSNFQPLLVSVSCLPELSSTRVN